jgi:hypothetical protein
MFGIFNPQPFVDSQLGALQRSQGLWRGAVLLRPRLRLPLAICGARLAPDPEALEIARSIPEDFAALQSELAVALFEHLSPYAEAILVGELPAPPDGLPRVSSPEDVWPHAHPVFVSVTQLDRQLTVEIGYRVAWDEEHTLGARIRCGRLVELCGSVRVP